MSSIAQTRHGKVEGVRENGLCVFKGIPYAAPPVGALRWLPPAPPEPWSGVRTARELSVSALQNGLPEEVLSAIDLKAMSVPGEQGEDCLTLNVWTPGLDDARRPVMVWIHGGGFTIGSSAQPIYDGQTLARRGDVVVVTINYRLGTLGFLNLAELTGGRIPATGNEGLLDQAAALEWVRDNVAAFGGDPDNVTIFGESAGGMSVGALLAMPRARGLFHRAIPQSGSCSTASPLARAVKVAERVLGALGISPDDVDALRALPPERLLEVQAELTTPGAVDPELGSMLLQPVIDGEVLPSLPLDAVASGSASGVAVLVGSTLDEWRLFAPADPDLFSLDEAGLLERLCVNLRKDEATRIVEAYRKARDARGAPASPPELLMAIETDRVFRIPGTRLAEEQRRHDPRVFSYLFTYPSPAIGGLLGSCHALELGFLFGTNDSADIRGFSGTGPAADALERAMQDSWIAFARSADPSCEALGSWPAYSERRETMILDGESRVEPAPYEEERRAWESIADTGNF